MGVLDRTRASLLGFAVGDAFGATTENRSAKEIQETIGVHKNITGGGWLGLEPGQVTDDTETLLCVANSLVSCKGFDPRDMADRLVEWYNDDPIDIGHTCRAGINRYIKTGELTRPPADDQAGNGALMRVLPFALTELDESNVLTHVALTHNNTVSNRIIGIYLSMIREARLGRGITRILRPALRAEEFEVQSGHAYNSKAGGYVVETFNTVLHCFRTTSSFEDALIKCANLGGDADTTCAILGGLAGAHYGLEAIPKRWLDVLDKDVSNELGGLASSITALKIASVNVNI